MKEKASPEFINERLPLKKFLPPVRLEVMNRDWEKVGSINGTKIEMYENKRNSALIAGVWIEDNFLTRLEIIFRISGEPVHPPQLKNFLQVAFVDVAEGFEERGLASSVYRWVVNHHDLVSDQIHYIGGRLLWESLSKDPNVYVYVFDGLYSNDYLRNRNGSPIRYHNQNINQHEIWRTDQQYRSVLLVAKKEPL